MKLIVGLLLLASLPLHAGEKDVKPADKAVTRDATVGGHVRRPGPVVFRKDLTLFAAIHMAGGATEFGSLRRVKVLRGENSTLHDLRDDRQKLVRVQPGDLIEVPQKTLFGR